MIFSFFKAAAMNPLLRDCLPSAPASSEDENHNTQRQLMTDLKKVCILIAIVIFLGIGYAARFLLTMDEVFTIGYQILTSSSEESGY